MLPEAFCRRMKEMLKEEYGEFEDSFSLPKKQALRFNLCKTDDLSVRSQMPFTLTPVPWEASGFFYEEGERPGKSVFHEAGVYYIQEPSAMAPAACLDVKPGDFVLDLCAAPGGKSTQIASYLKQEGLLISNEIHPARAKILSENIERMGLSNCIVTNESSGSLAKKFPAYFDKIMVDAPCSGEGMFRKNENAADEWSLENVKLCADRQDEILSNAALMLRAGGRIVYSTCTFAPLENEGSIARFLESHPDFHVVSVSKHSSFSDGNPDWIGKILNESGLPDISRSNDETASYSGDIRKEISHTIRLWPHKTNGEGHFVAVLERDGIKDESSHPNCRDGVIRGVSEKNCKELISFIENETTFSLNGTLVPFGDRIFLLPDYAPSIAGLKVLRPGLHLGTVLKNRFEPSHALALYLKPQQARHTLNFSHDDLLVQRYIGGEGFPYDGEKGWYLITVDGYSLGWGKCAGGQMKNHYPKGLRKQL